MGRVPQEEALVPQELAERLRRDLLVEIEVLMSCLEPVVVGWDLRLQM